MSDQPDYFEQVAEGEAIDDFLVSLASGLASAQQQLSELTSTDALGAGGVTYQIPRLDFELSLQIHTETNTNSGNSNQRSRRKTRVQAVSSSSNDLTANSLLKGSFVAVPVNGGRPQPIISLSFAETDNASQVAVVVNVTDATGVPHVGVEVEVNVDKELSEEVNKREGVETSLKADTRIVSGVVTTNAQGVAEAILNIAKGEAKGVNVAVTADAQSASTSLMYRTGS